MEVKKNPKVDLQNKKGIFLEIGLIFSLALCLAEKYLSDKSGAWRVHGGGFAGTIQAFMPESVTADYAKLMDSVFGEGATYILRIRNKGAICVY